VLIELVRQAAAVDPDRSVVVTRSGRVTYGECLARSEAIARGLLAQGIERFACQVDDVGLLVPLLCGASAAGSEACMYPLAFDAAAVATYAPLFDHNVVVTDRDPSLSSPRVVPVASLVATGGDAPLPAPTRAPVMILTTGTTGTPKGARHDWARLVGTTRRRDAPPGERWLLAYNLNQFAGVQVLLHVLASKATLVAPPTNQPRDAVAIMRDEGVTHASATPTFWRFVTGLLDESQARELPLEQITLGGEAVPPSLLEALARLFPEARISQVYASTEFGAALSVRDQRIGLPMSVLERGADADVQFRVVDGELHARSKVGMLGYYGEEHQSDDWRPTGDLVEVRGERIHFVGRTSEVINVGGVKVHPLPVEDLVSALDGVALVHAYGRANPVSGQIVALDVVARPGADTAALESRIREACESLPPPSRPRRIKFVDQLDVRGHKLVRGAKS
jgi:acyl-CoA synthetase (AMP-forming)/AMP-acid ligase II